MELTIVNLIMMRIHSHLDRPIRFLHLGRNSTKMYTKTQTNNSMANKFKINFIYPVSLDKTRRQLVKCALKVQRQYLKVLSSKVTKTLKCKDNKCILCYYYYSDKIMIVERILIAFNRDFSLHRKYRSRSKH